MDAAVCQPPKRTVINADQRLCREIDQTYDPARLDSCGVLFRTSEIDGGQSVHLYDKTLGWKNLFGGGLEIIPISGNHYSIFREQIPTIAQGIDQVLKQRPQERQDSFLTDTHSYPSLPQTKKLTC